MYKFIYDIIKVVLKINQINQIQVAWQNIMRGNHPNFHR
jgi:hypothetical protein